MTADVIAKGSKFPNDYEFKGSVIMADPRKGRQTPTKSIVLPYEKTYGNEAIELYNSTGRTAQEWQEIQMYDILAYNSDDLWVHTKYGYSVPRRNGKNETFLLQITNFF